MWKLKYTMNKSKTPTRSNINNINQVYILYLNFLVTNESDKVLRVNSKYGVSVSNGTNALLVALKALSIGTGDEVITVSNTAIATASSIISSGAKIRFTDIGNDYLIDPKKIENHINKRTKAIIIVHTTNKQEINK